MKDLKDICFIVQARLGSQRIPEKMLKPFYNTTLTDIILDKIKSVPIIRPDQFYFAVHEDELVKVGLEHNVQIFRRTQESADSESLQEIYEWYKDLSKKYKYVILISGCNPFLTIGTIQDFINVFVESENEGMFAVTTKKNYFWNNKGKLITPLDPELKIMNTKFVDKTYEAAHCLYASRLDIIKDGYFMSNQDNMKGLLLYEIHNELETFDIDHEWQFKLAKSYYGEKQTIV